MEYIYKSRVESHTCQFIFCFKVEIEQQSVSVHLFLKPSLDQPTTSRTGLIVHM